MNIWTAHTSIRPASKIYWKCCSLLLKCNNTDWITGETPLLRDHVDRDRRKKTFLRKMPTLIRVSGLKKERKRHPLVFDDFSWYLGKWYIQSKTFSTQRNWSKKVSRKHYFVRKHPTSIFGSLRKYENGVPRS